MTKCKCSNWDVGQNDFVEDDSSTGAYCSYYCRRYHEEGYQKVLASDSQYHNNHWLSQDRSRMRLLRKHHEDYLLAGHQERCQGSAHGIAGGPCGGRKKAKPRWAILRSLKQLSPCTVTRLPTFSTAGSIRIPCETFPPYCDPTSARESAPAMIGVTDSSTIDPWDTSLLTNEKV